MDKPASLSPAARILAILVGLAAAAALYMHWQTPVTAPAAPTQAAAASPTASASAAASSPVPASAATPNAGKQQAMAALMSLPELKTWSAKIELSSGGKRHGALIEYDPTPKLVAGKPYWQLSFVENGAEAVQAWDSFLVAQDGGDILVEDLANDKQLTLAQWRKTRHPLERSGPDAAQ